jgi:hypothetical protein
MIIQNITDTHAIFRMTMKGLEIMKVTAKPVVNCNNLTFWKMEDEENETYGEANSLAGRMMAFTDTLTTNSTNLNGDGEIVDTAVGIAGGQLKIDIHQLTDAERVLIYGETITNGSVVTTGNESTPAVCVAAAAPHNISNIVNLYKWFKVRFAPNEEGAEQISEGKKSFKTITCNGSYSKNAALGYMRAKVSAVDISTTEGKALYDNWFTDAAYIGTPTGG